MVVEEISGKCVHMVAQYGTVRHTKDVTTERQMDRETFVQTYRITTNRGEFRSRAQVIKTIAAHLRGYGVANASQIAARFVDNHEWLLRRAGETAGSIARQVADASVTDWRFSWLTD